MSTSEPESPWPAMVRLRTTYWAAISAIGCVWLVLVTLFMIMLVVAVAGSDGAGTWPVLLLLLVMIALISIVLLMYGLVRVELTAYGVTVYTPFRVHVPWSRIRQVVVLDNGHVGLATTTGGVVSTPLRRPPAGDGAQFQFDLATMRQWHELYGS